MCSMLFNMYEVKVYGNGFGASWEWGEQTGLWLVHVCETPLQGYRIPHNELYSEDSRLRELRELVRLLGFRVGEATLHKILRLRELLSQGTNHTRRPEGLEEGVRQYPRVEEH